MSPPEVNSPVIGNLPFWPLGVKTATMSCPPSTVHGGCRSRTLLQTGKLPHPLHHWGLCCWLWALSSFLKLSKHRPCRPAGWSPTSSVCLPPTEGFPWRQFQSSCNGRLMLWEAKGRRRFISFSYFLAHALWAPVRTQEHNLHKSPSLPVLISNVPSPLTPPSQTAPPLFLLSSLLWSSIALSEITLRT